MSVPEHTHTEQEQAIWDHMEAGEHDQIEQMREDATEPEDREQYEEDRSNAWAHYQDAHEPI